MDRRNNQDSSPSFKIDQMKTDILGKVGEKAKKILQHTKESMKKGGVHVIDRGIQAYF